MKGKPEMINRRWRGILFPLGLLIVLIAAHTAIEWKTYARSYEDVVGEILQDDEEDVPITEQFLQPPPPPPPPPAAPTIIEVVEDEEEVEETVIESTETDQEEIVDVEDIEVEEEFEDVEVPFAIIEEIPSWPQQKNRKSREEFQMHMNNHIRKHFRYPEIAQELGVQGRVFIRFVIQKDGSIEITGIRGPDPSLEKEAKRIISKIPKLIPGKQRGREVPVPFSLPITFRLQ